MMVVKEIDPMTRLASLLGSLLLGLGFLFFSTGPAAAQPNECFLGCNAVAHGCMEGLRSDRRGCKDECRGLPPGPARGHCKRDCARVPLADKAGCRIDRDRCRAECLDGAKACHFDCAATARECSVLARTTARECRMTCRTEAEMAAEECAVAADPEACLEAVAEQRGLCLDACGTAQGSDLEACAQGFMVCKEACRPDDPNEPPDGNEP